MAGDVFVTLGDVSEFQADAVVCSTSTYVAAGGLTFHAFVQRFPQFEQAFLDIHDRHPVRNERGQRLKIGDAFWIPVEPGGGRLQGIVLVAVTGGPETVEEAASRSVRSALRVARDNLSRLRQGRPGERWLIAVPPLGLGMGGYSRELTAATEAIVRTASEEIESPVEVGGVAVETDVAIVAFTLLNYRLFLEARRTVGAEPPCPLETAQARELLDSIRDRRCVLFAGAGLSRAAGLPDWGGLLQELAGELQLDARQLPCDAAGQLSLDLCLDLAQWYVDRFSREKLEQRVHDQFGRTEARTPAVRPTLAHYLLSAMPFRLFLTTNYDDLFERTLRALHRDPEVVCRPEAVVQTGQADRPCVVKLHGDSTERTPIVLTRDDFDTYFRNHPVTAALLQGLLLNHTFLFVGYDLRDPNTRQVYSGVAHLLGKSGTRAYSVVVREEDVTSQFYESQWERQGLITLRMPGPDRIHHSLCFFDWLARQTCELRSFLHPHLQGRELPAEFVDLEPLRRLLYQAADQMTQALKATEPGPGSAERVRLLAAVVELVTRLGWRPTGVGGLARTWEELARASPDHRDKMHYLRRAMSAAEGVSDLDRLRTQIQELSQLPHPAPNNADSPRGEP